MYAVWDETKYLWLARLLNKYLFQPAIVLNLLVCEIWFDQTYTRPHMI